MDSFAQVGLRLRHLRRQKGVGIEVAAKSAGISRALLYRYEAGEIVKVDVLQRLARVYATSLASLLGADQEYFANVVTFFERLEALEAEAVRNTTVFGPMAYVLTSDGYDDALFRTLSAQSQGADGLSAAELSRLKRVLRRRRSALRERQPNFINIVPIDEVSRFLEQAVAGADVRVADRASIRSAARREVIYLSRLLSNPPMGVQIGLTEKPLPTSGFQLLVLRDRTLLVASPFRLAEPINLRYGVATITGDEQAVRSHENLIARLWADVLTGQVAAKRLEMLLARRD